MSISLKLCSQSKPDVDIGLYDSKRHTSYLERVRLDEIETIGIYSDEKYELEVLCEGDGYKNVQLYINGEQQNCEYHDGKLKYVEGSRLNLTDCLGYVEFSLTVETNNDRVIALYSNYYPVIINNSANNEKIADMTSFIYEHFFDFFFEGDRQSRVRQGVGDDYAPILENKISTMHEIINIYRENYGYFRANARFHMDQKEEVVSLEKVQYFSSKSLRYISAHPEVLKMSLTDVGIEYNHKHYYPEKIETEQFYYSKNIYENNIILGFLNTLVKETNDYISYLDETIATIPSTRRLDNVYMFSPTLLYSGTRRVLEDQRKNLERIASDLNELLFQYESIFEIRAKALAEIPEATDIFLSVREYHLVFKKIQEWFNNGIYDFSRENYLLSFIRASQLYESYVLARLINDFQQLGFELTERVKFDYPHPTDSTYYRNTNICNTFYFDKNNRQFVLYYQPVVYMSEHVGSNGVDLYRTTSVTISDYARFTSERYYLPDFAIRTTNGNTRHYIILDAKYSDNTQINRHIFRDLSFKYQVSISANNNAVLAGVIVVYGKGHTRRCGELIS